MEKREGLELYFGDRINRTMDGPRCGGKKEGHHMSPALGQICIVRNHHKSSAHYTHMNKQIPPTMDQLGPPGNSWKASISCRNLTL